MKKLLSVVLVVVMLLSCAPLSGLTGADPIITAYAAGEGIYAKLNSLKSKFPEGYFWNHKVTAYSNNGDQLVASRNESFANSVTSSHCATHNGVASVGQYDCNYFDGGIQCFGFAGKIFYDVFGQRKSGLQKVYNNNYGVSVGDYVRVNNDTHSAVVLSKNGNYITVVECNLSGGGNIAGNCKIRWGASYPISSITYYCHATNYSQIDNTNVNYFQSVSSSNVSETDARIDATIIGTNLSTCGFYIGKSQNSMTKKAETVNGYVEKIWYVMSSDFGKLEPCTTYYYKFFITVGGIEYCSEVKTFKTTGTTYTVSYNANGGSGVPANQTKVTGQKITLSSTIPTRTNYTFKCWNTKADGSGTNYNSGSIYSADASATLYAQWTYNKKNYKVTYNGNGGTSILPYEYVEEGSSINLTTPFKYFKINYDANGGTNAPSASSLSVECLGWSTNSSSSTATYKCGASYKPASNVTLYAIWENTVNTTLSANKPVREGYIFLGWSENPNATEADFSAGESVDVSGDATLYAVWGTNVAQKVYTFWEWIIIIVFFGWIWYI